MKITILISILLFTFGQAFAQPTEDHPDFIKLQTILQKLSSRDSTQQYQAAQTLTELKTPAALSLAEFVITGKTQVPGHSISFESESGSLREHLLHPAKDYLTENYSKFLSVPGFYASFKRVYGVVKDPFNHIRLAKSLKGCTNIQCLELFDLVIKSKNSLVRAYAYKMLRNFDLKLDRIQSLIQTGLQSVHHAEKAYATFALLGRKDPEVIPLAELALNSLNVVTRIYAIGALAEIHDPAVFPVYREGLKDSDRLVRYFTIFALGRRTEPAARQLLEQVQKNDPELRPRTEEEQDRQAPLRERWAESRRAWGDSFHWLNSIHKGSPGLNWTVGLNMKLRRPREFISEWMWKGRTEADLAKLILENAENNDPSVFNSVMQEESALPEDSNLIRFSGRKLNCSSIHSN